MKRTTARCISNAKAQRYSGAIFHMQYLCSDHDEFFKQDIPAAGRLALCLSLESVFESGGRLSCEYSSISSFTLKIEEM